MIQNKSILKKNQQKYFFNYILKDYNKNIAYSIIVIDLNFQENKTIDTKLINNIRINYYTEHPKSKSTLNI
jgi:hypothetical protein